MRHWLGQNHRHSGSGRFSQDWNFPDTRHSRFREVSAAEIRWQGRPFFQRFANRLGEPPTSRILVSDSPTSGGKPIVPNVDVLLSSAGAPWNDLVLEWQRLPPGEVPKLFPKQHTILVYLNRKPLSMERLSNGCLRRLDALAGDICIGPAGSMTGLRWWGDALEALAISPSQAAVERIAAEWYAPGRVEFIRHDRVRDPLIEQIGLALRADLLEGSPFGSLYGDALTTALAVRLLRRYSSNASSGREFKGGLGGHRLRLTIDYIEGHLTRNLQLNELANNVGLTPAYFCTAFERSTGLPPHQWVLRRRIDRAKELLVKGKTDLVQIADTLGFADQSHFCRVFRRFAGASPGAFARETR